MSIPRPEEVVDFALVDDVLRLKDELVAAEKKLSEDLLQKMDLPNGSILRDKETGALYRVDGGFAGTSYGRNRPTVSLRLTRVYRSGRRPASSSSFRSTFGLERYEGELK